MSLAIRRARPDEAGLVLSLVRELAEYEKLLHEVEASEAAIDAALGAVLMDEWTVCRIGGPALTALAQGTR